jgi:hypothetical protein
VNEAENATLPHFLISMMPSFAATIVGHNPLMGGEGGVGWGIGPELLVELPLTTTTIAIAAITASKPTPMRLQGNPSFPWAFFLHRPFCQ